MQDIRNFAIIAHVDHGKSTLADRFLELSGVVKKGAHQEQFLDRNPISRERGITIKLAPVQMKIRKVEVRGLKLDDEVGGEKNPISNFKNPASNIQIPASNSEYVLNLIDTPGHVDFSYEVDRTLSCVEGVILLVDATKGLQAQTIANAYKALEKNLVIIPVVNKIDLPQAKIAQTKKDLSEFLGISEDEVFEVSAKTGQGAEALLKAVIERIPPPVIASEAKQSYKQIAASSTTPRNNNKLQALVFDSYYDSHRGVIAFVRVFGGSLQKAQKVNLVAEKINFQIMEVGVFIPDLKAKVQLESGEIGYVVTNLKDIHKVRVGDTITDNLETNSFLEGYKTVRPMVFASIFPTDPNEYLNLKKALEKLYLNDSSLQFSPISSRALGAGFRVGFLGLLHADVVRERLEREHNLNLVLTPPQVEYDFKAGVYYEPIVKILIIVPQKYLGEVLRLSDEHRGKFVTMDNKQQISLVYELPMSEMISDFFDQLKSVSSGFASLDWEFLKYQVADASKLEIMLNGDPIEEFSQVVVKEQAQEKANNLVKKLKEIIPRQQYEVKIQAKYKGKIIASQRIAPFRKDVTKGLYGGDRTRKDKVLERQKEGKKKMKMVGRVEIPKEAFVKLFRR